MEKTIKEKNSLADNKKMRFATESIPKLLVSLAVPAIIANLVNALYNIVDQIFIGQKIGFLGNAATNVAFPLTTICLAIGLMTGVGAATNFNLELGRKRPKRAKSVAGTAVTMLLLGGIILCILINIFLRPMLTAFGATNQIFDYESIKGLSNIAISGLMYGQPETIGQASRISGVTSNDISLLIAILKN